MNLGIAFQLADDLLDYAGEPEHTGKNVGDDLNEGKITLPLLHAMKEGSEKERLVVANALRNKDGEAFADIMAIVKRTGGIEATRAAAVHHQQLATASLHALGTSEPLEALRQMANKAVDRQG